MLADIGFNIRFQAPAPYAPVYGLMFVSVFMIRRKKRPSAEQD